jgi:hypothetical protein
MTSKLMMGVTAFALIAGTGFALAQAGDAPISEQTPGAATGQLAPAGRPAPGTTQSSEGVRTNKEERNQHTRSGENAGRAESTGQAPRAEPRN